MNKLTLSLLALLIGFGTVIAQTPEGFNYQAALRDGSGNVLASKSVSIRVSILQGGASGTIVYVETNQSTTSALGLVNLKIGEGSVVSGNFSNIDWAAGQYFIEVALDENGGTTYNVMGTSQLLSVPFAMHAKTATNATEANKAEHALVSDSATNAINAEHAFIADNVFSGDYNDLVNIPPVTITLSGGNINCFGSSDGFVNSTVSGGTSPYTYKWSNDATSEYISDIVAGTYSLVVTDNTGNTSSNSIVITESEKIAVSITKNDPSCFEGTNGQINLIVSGGKQPYNYEWSNGSFSQNQTNLPAGVYKVKIIDANNCFINQEVELISPTKLAVSETLIHVDCYGSNTGSIALEVSGGEAPFTYSWSNGSTTKNISSIVAGVYSVTVTDSGGCTSSYEYQINSNPELLITNEQITLSCETPINGSIVVEVEGGADPMYTYLWSNGSAMKDIYDIASGEYELTVTDIQGCSKIFSFIVGNSNNFTLGSTINDEVNSASDGSIVIEPSGGLNPYDYSWSTGLTTSSLHNISAGSYDVNVYDANGCLASESYNIDNVISATDFDGNSYGVVRIGDQIWTTENLVTAHYNDGWEIIGYRYPANIITNETIYGKLYSFDIVQGGNMCQVGWHVPSKVEWDQLITYLRGGELAGGPLKETGTTHWRSPNPATNQSGFTALPADFNAAAIGNSAYFWTSTTSGTTAYYYQLFYSDTRAIYATNYAKSVSMSVRCIKD